MVSALWVSGVGADLQRANQRSRWSTTSTPETSHLQVEQRDAATEMAPRPEGSSGGGQQGPRTGLGSDPKARILLSGDIESNPGPPRRLKIVFKMLMLMSNIIILLGKWRVSRGILCRVVGILVIKQLACFPTLAISNQSWEMIAADDDEDGGDLKEKKKQENWLHICPQVNCREGSNHRWKAGKSWSDHFKLWGQGKIFKLWGQGTFCFFCVPIYWWRWTWQKDRYE